MTQMYSWMTSLVALFHFVRLPILDLRIAGEIDEHLVCENGSRERMIDVHTFLALALQEYHNTRPQDEFNHDEHMQNRYDSDEVILLLTTHINA